MECERLQGFPDGWTENGLSSIMEVCVNMSLALAGRLQKSGTAYFTINAGSDTALQFYPRAYQANADIVIEEPLPAPSASDITNLGNATVMLFNQSEMWNTGELTKKNGISEQMDAKFISKLWRLTLDANLSKEKLSTILTSIREIMASPTSIFAKIEPNTIGVIIRSNSPGQSCSSGASFALKAGTIVSISDTQRYKCLGNAVTVNVIEAVVSAMLN
jgi:hypothetical protein